MSYEKLLQGYFNYANEENLTELLELFAEDAELKAPGKSLRCGKEQIGKFYLGIFEHPKHIDTPLRIIENGDCVVVEIKGEAGAKNGGESIFNAVDIFDFEKGKIKKLNIYYDNYEIMKNLGLLNRKA